MTAVPWRIDVDRETCVGSGMCTAIASNRFVLVADRARAVDATVEPDEAVLDAAESCPMEAIVVRDEAGRVLAPER
ncbi:ferredoxin [Umezawaea beigongshangensis]|uniref:ferredoxin n=1 Tax=Umezawaea beigongshangensis TaxID=2780383 RepID=UPI0027DC315A|nr:ferredoxin [Umezawaea beigongshangensis]